MSVFDADGSSAIGQSSRTTCHRDLHLLKPVWSAGRKRHDFEIRLIFTKRSQCPEKQAH